MQEIFDTRNFCTPQECTKIFLHEINESALTGPMEASLVYNCALIYAKV